MPTFDLTPIGYKIGLISQKRYDSFCKKNRLVESLVAFARGLSVKPDEINDCLKSLGCDAISQGRKLHDLLMRNNVTFDLLSGVLPKLGDFLREQEMDAEVVEEAEIQIKYKGYIEREKFIADKLHRLENIRIPGRFRFPFDECPDDRSPAETHPNPTCDDRAGFPYSRSFSGGCECVAGEIRSVKYRVMQFNRYVPKFDNRFWMYLSFINAD